MTQPPPPAKFAAAVVPRLADGRVLVGIRTRSARSWPGYLAFPGGAVEDSDAALPLCSTIDVERKERAAALRELGEESGIWMVAHASGAAAHPAARARFDEALARGAPIDEALRASELVLDDRRLVAMARFTTPAALSPSHAPFRFTVRQMLLPFDELPHRGPCTDELEDLQWLSPDDIHARWWDGRVFLLPPIRFVVAGLAASQGAGDDVPGIVARLSARLDQDGPELRDIVAGVAVEPLRTPTLPPATTTNAVLLGAGDFLIVDPATPYDDERARFDALLSHLHACGRRPTAIVLTHHHHDHVGDVARLKERYGLPCWAHAETASRVDFPVERLLVDGEVLLLPGDPPRRVRCVHTPGHAPGHLCFFEETSGVLVAGDMVAAVGSILIDPPEGHMGTYLVSLERLLALPIGAVVPAHGPLLAAGHQKLAEHLHHRRLRHQQVVLALPKDGPGATAEELAAAIYAADTPALLLPLAARSVAAILELCVEQRQARQQGLRFSQA